MKLAVRERETDARQTYLGSDPMVVSSALAIVEVHRGARVARPLSGAQRTREVLEGIVLLDVDRALLEDAVSYSSADVRSLDAIHVATAVRARVTSMLVYDRALAGASEAAGLEILAPGA